MLVKALRAWNKYKYRFVPWIAHNINENSPRVIVPHLSKKDELSNSQVTEIFTNLFRKYIVGDKIRPFTTEKTDFLFNMQVCEDTLGFTIEKEPSQLEDGGTGAFVSTGHIKKGSVVAIYPGTVYQPWEPVFFVSVANAYLFRCLDGVHIDGSSDGLSKSIFMSCAKRDRHMGEFTCDISWMGDYPLNPLSIGQYVNNQTKDCPANVAYQEYDVPMNFPWDLRRFLPNIEARTAQGQGIEEFDSDRLLKMVILVALRDIEAGEELLSSYYTLVYGDEEEAEEIEGEDERKQEIEGQRQIDTEKKQRKT